MLAREVLRLLQPTTGVHEPSVGERNGYQYVIILRVPSGVI